MLNWKMPPKRKFKKGDIVAFKEKNSDGEVVIREGSIKESFDNDVARNKYGMRIKPDARSTVWFLVRTPVGLRVKNRRDLKWPKELRKEEASGDRR